MNGTDAPGRPGAVVGAPDREGRPPSTLCHFVAFRSAHEGGESAYATPANRLGIECPQAQPAGAIRVADRPSSASAPAAFTQKTRPQQ